MKAEGLKSHLLHKHSLQSTSTLYQTRASHWICKGWLRHNPYIGGTLRLSQLDEILIETYE